MGGRRAQYLHPVKMYIFISLVYFLLFFQQKSSDPVKFTYKQMTTTELAAAIKGVNASKYIPDQAKKEAINDLYKDNGYIIVNNRPVKDTSKKEKEREKEATENPHVMNPSTKDTSYAQYTANQNKLPDAKRDGWFERYYNKKAFAINKEKINIREVVEDSIKHNFPKMMFVLLPLFALILSTTFYKSKKFYVEHLIYSFHLHCFIFLFLTVLMILKFVIPASWDTLEGWLEFAATIAIILYIYKSLRAVYHRNGWRTITKMIGMSVTYSIVFFVCFMILLGITVLTAA